MRSRLQNLRKAQGLTQTQFVEAVGCSRSHYEMIETGDRTPSLGLAMRIKAALNYHSDDLFDNSFPNRRRKRRKKIFAQSRPRNGAK